MQRTIVTHRDEIGRPHFNTQYAGKTIAWSGSDQPELFAANLKDPRRRNKLEKYRWTEPNCISYSYNSFGFRDEEFDQRPAGLALGCSHTEGVGIPQNTTWPAVLGTMLNTKVWNLGVGGSSLDTSFRFLDYWISKLNIKFVCVCIPPLPRFEVFQDWYANSVTQYQNTPDEIVQYFKLWSTYDHNCEINHRKNLLAMEQICQQHNVPMVTRSTEDWVGDAAARDCMHNGVESNRDMAQQFYQLLQK